MLREITVPSRKTFCDLITASVPSNFRHDLTCSLNLPPKVCDLRGSESTKEQLQRMLSLLAEGHPISFGDPLTVSRQLLLVTMSGNGTGRTNDERGIIAVANRIVRGGVEDSVWPAHYVPSLTLVFFPAPEHSRYYLQAGAFSRKLGPADMFPGSIGTLTLFYDPGARTSQIESLQSSVNHSKSEVREILTQPDLNLCAKYFRWRADLLDLAFAFTARLGLESISVGPSDDYRYPLIVKMRGHDFVVEKALKDGFTLSADRMTLFAPASKRYPA